MTKKEFRKILTPSGYRIRKVIQISNNQIFDILMIDGQPKGEAYTFKLQSHNPPSMIDVDEEEFIQNYNLVEETTT